MEEIQNSAKEVTANATARAQLITAKSQANYQVSQAQDTHPLDSKKFVCNLCTSQWLRRKVHISGMSI